MLARLTQLARNLVIYGIGDVATSILSFLLLPIYVRYLSPADYGVISLLLTVEVVAKILFRWGVDASFMRLYYDCQDDGARQRLASTIFWFLAVLNGSLLALGLAAAPWFATHLFGTANHVTALRLVLFNTFVVGFYFIPFHVLRIQGRSPQFIALTVTRSFATLVLRLLLVVVLRQGVMGVVLADVFVTVAFTLALLKWFAPLIRPVLDKPVLREALSFGLPRVPHGVAHQAVAVADRYILAQFVTLREVGLYSIGASFGLAMKLFLSAFEYAWAPFYFATMAEPDAKRTFRIVTTYGVAALVLLAAGLAAVSDDVVRLMTTPEFYAAAAVVPWIGMGVLFQGVYLLTSIGLNITKQTAYYPAATACAAFTSVAANLWLVPRFGAMGAAYANSIAYAVLALAGMALSQRFYPIGYEWGRIMRVAIAGLGAFLAARLLLPSQMSPLPGVLARGGVVLAAYPVLLMAMGFYQPREIAATAALFRGVRRGKAAPTEETSELAGEIVSTSMPDETGELRDVSPQTALAATDEPKARR